MADEKLDTFGVTARRVSVDDACDDHRLRAAWVFITGDTANAIHADLVGAWLGVDEVGPPARRSIARLDLLRGAVHCTADRASQGPEAISILGCEVQTKAPVEVNHRGVLTCGDWDA